MVGGAQLNRFVMVCIYINLHMQYLEHTIVVMYHDMQLLTVEHLNTPSMEVWMFLTVLRLVTKLCTVAQMGTY